MVSNSETDPYSIRFRQCIGAEKCRSSKLRVFRRIRPQTAVALECVQQLLDVETHLAKKIAEIARAILGAQGKEFFSGDVERVVSDQSVQDDEVTVYGDG